MYPHNTQTANNFPKTHEDQARWSAHRAIRRIIEAFRGRVLPIDLVVLDFIRGDLAAQGYTMHSHGFIATGCGVSINTVRRAMHRWVRRGILEPIVRTGMATVHRLIGPQTESAEPDDSPPPSTTSDGSGPADGDTSETRAGARQRLREWIRQRKQTPPQIIPPTPPKMAANSDTLRVSKTPPRARDGSPPTSQRRCPGVIHSTVFGDRYRDIAARMIRQGATRAQVLNALRQEISGRNESRLLALGTSARTANRLCKRYPADRIAAVLNASERVRPVNPGGWVYAALTRNWEIGDHHARR